MKKKNIEKLETVVAVCSVLVCILFVMMITALTEYGEHSVIFMICTALTVACTITITVCVVLMIAYGVPSVEQQTQTNETKIMTTATKCAIVNSIIRR